jgi:hypothetical protein
VLESAYRDIEQAVMKEAKCKDTCASRGPPHPSMQHSQTGVLHITPLPHARLHVRDTLRLTYSLPTLQASG